MEDYQKLYGRVKLNLNAISAADARAIPTDARVERAAREGTGDNYLSTLQYQSSRYLMIAASRPGDWPANLQGIWNQHLKPAWESDYHTNINLQMNYWFVEAANLAECHEPLVDYLDTLVSHGKRTAKVHYNAGGWVAHHASDLFGYTAPVAGVHGVWPVGGAWLARHSYEHYLFISILQKEDAAFDRDFQKRLIGTKQRLVPIQISTSGRIQEWIEDYKELELGHRHISHLYSLYPDNHISLTKTPQLAKAALKTLEVRLKGNPAQPKTKFGAFDSYLDGKKGTGWGRAWISLFYSRLGIGEEAYQHHRYLQSHFALPNLLGIAHGTYQIDNVFGNAAAIGEMLIQSQEGYVHLLPALSSKWKNGFVTGLRAVGGFEIGMQWENAEVITATVTASVGGLCKIKPGRPVRKVVSGKDGVSFRDEGTGVIAFETSKGRQYQLIF